MIKIFISLVGTKLTELPLLPCPCHTTSNGGSRGGSRGAPHPPPAFPSYLAKQLDPEGRKLFSVSDIFNPQHPSPTPLPTIENRLALLRSGYCYHTYVPYELCARRLITRWKTIYNVSVVQNALFLQSTNLARTPTWTAQRGNKYKK